MLTTKKILASTVGVVLFALIWQIASEFLFSNNAILPSPTQVLKALGEMSQSGVLLDDIVSSFSRILAGFTLAFLAASVFGIIAYRYSKIYNIVKVVMNLLSSIPPIAWTPLAILWFGIGNAPAYFIVFLGAFFPMFSNFYSGIKSVDKGLIDAAKTLGASNTLISSRIIFPYALPQIFVGIKIGLTVAWFNVIAAELIGVKSGLGYKIQLNRQLLASENVIGLMLVIGIIGLLMAGLVFIISNISVPWSLQDESREFWLNINRAFKKIFIRKSSIQEKTNSKAITIEKIENETLLKVEHISKVFHGKNEKDEVKVFTDISFSISKGEVVSIIGPNGCGKSTIINIIAGLLNSDDGKVSFENKVVSSTSSERTVVFQNFALFPWMTASENIEFAIEASETSNSGLNAHGYLIQAGLEGFAESYPFQLSGGMKQRLAIMRAIAAQPKLILMDEPFASFDPLVRNSSQETILQLLRNQNNTTVLIVTHDIDEAIFMSDKILILSKRPAVLKEIVSVDLQRPRNDSMRLTEQFTSKRNYLWNLLRV